MNQWTVRDVMTTEVISVAEDTSYRKIVDTLAHHRISAVPVLDAGGRVVGIISEADVLHKVEKSEDIRELHPFPWHAHRSDDAKARAATARDLMATPVITVGPDESVVAAARLIAREHVKSLPVTDERHSLLGIVSRRDLMKMHLRTDDEIKNDILDNVVRRSLWLDPETLRVDVNDGEVELHGALDRRTTAEFLTRLIERVPGVVKVTDRLSWKRNDAAYRSPQGREL